MTWIDDCEPPSWLMLSGWAVTLIDVREIRRAGESGRLGLMHSAAGQRDSRQQEPQTKGDPS